MASEIFNMINNDMIDCFDHYGFNVKVLKCVIDRFDAACNNTKFIKGFYQNANYLKVFDCNTTHKYNKIICSIIVFYAFIDDFLTQTLNYTIGTGKHDINA